MKMTDWEEATQTRTYAKHGASHAPPLVEAAISREILRDPNPIFSGGEAPGDGKGKVSTEMFPSAAGGDHSGGRRAAEEEEPLDPDPKEEPLDPDPKEEASKHEEELDPRIQEELERLNLASEEINRLELQLDDARSSYRKVLTDSARKLNAQASQLGACIDKARPYYEARRLAKEAQQETQRAALRYERAVSMHTAAREMVYVAEQGLLADKSNQDPTWQEMLNHSTTKVNEAEEERLRSEREHQRVTQLCQDAETRVQTLQKTLRKVILKSKSYFELKAQFNHILEEHKAQVMQLEEEVVKVKTRYSLALRNLEQISEQIHAQRGRNVASRGRLSVEGRSSPVGAESEVKGATGFPSSSCVEVSGVESDWADGEKTRLWVERHRESGWGQRESCEAEQAASDSITSLQTIASDLEKCDSVEHLFNLSDGGSVLSEDAAYGNSLVSKEVETPQQQEILVKQHQRSVSL
ncbi:PREDICTED: SH3 domain-binding protein 5-like [Cyprinodon variegatus]|uniref:SH3 domain-binding protein 5 n=1 Tax=Cyprinodon variegatus TaxID=28743 RepID=A0A3Q2DPF6_CYPVA|nr:PREDICTED: SH3 domain-binding protein 5-like [Cyprinodon variegatus]